ncbi:MAG: hypothetical protein IK079_02780, partial [Desulfovibrio sp.]|nr:hypothetical protein [Desulfovibrio sp.]
LDVLFPDLAHDPLKPGPMLGERRVNRARLKAKLLGQEYIVSSKLTISEELKNRLEERHILLCDVECAIEHIDAQKLWCRNQENGHRLGSWRPRKVTFWVEYSPNESGYVLHDAWCHRMIVPGSGGSNAEEVIKTQQCCTDGGRRERV